MTQNKSSSLTQLIEVFPTWPQEDLQTALNEAGGDVYVAISRISEGHFSQWSDSTKKTALAPSTFETRPTRTDRNDRIQSRENSNYSNKSENKADSARGQRTVREQRDRPHSTGNRSSAPVKTVASIPNFNVTKSNNAIEDIPWGDSAQTPSSDRPVASLTRAAISNRAFTAPKTSFADAAASALAENPKSEIPDAPMKTISSESSIEAVTENFESELSNRSTVKDLSESVVAVEVIVSEVESILSVEAACIVEPSVIETEIFEEEEIVFMPARATPSLTMEQPAVVLPVRTNLRTNLTVRFGYDSSEDLMTPTGGAVDKAAIEDTQTTKTPITVSALESTFAMLSGSVPAAKSPEPILSQPALEVSAWETSRNSGFGAGSSANNASTGYGNFSRSRQHGGWDYEPTNSTSAANSSSTTQGSFGPAPGFSGPVSPAAPQRFVSRAAAQYEHANVYNSSNSPSGNTVNPPRFSPYEETNAADNNVSQYYTTRIAPQATSGGYPVYRGGNSFNSSRYSTSSRPYYQQHHSAAHPHHQQSPAPHQQSPAPQQQSPPTGHYNSYNPHQNYLNNYHHGYPQYSQHVDQYSHQQHQQPQQPYYQPYQPPNQYLSNSNMHHHSHHQNQHHNA